MHVASVTLYFIVFYRDTGRWPAIHIFADKMCKSARAISPQILTTDCERASGPWSLIMRRANNARPVTM